MSKSRLNNRRKNLTRSPHKSKKHNNIKHKTFHKSRSIKRRSQRKSNSIKRKSSRKIQSINQGYKWMDTSKFKKNSLGKYNYKTSVSVSQRHAALQKAIKAYGAHSVWSKLNAVSILNKNRSPKTAYIFSRDKNWVKNNYIK